jgi:hypothetical protein
MEDKYKKLLGSINIIEPPKGLEGRILARINMEEKRLARIRTWLFGSTSVASLGLSIWAVVYLTDSIKQTGFWQYFSLLFSGDSAIYAYWKELSFSLAESLPIVSLIIFLTAVGFFIWSFGKTITHPALSYNKRGFSPISPLL